MRKLKDVTITEKIVAIVWLIVAALSLRIVWLSEHPCEPHIQYNKYLALNPEWVQEELKNNWDIKFVKRIGDDSYYGVTNFDKNTIKVRVIEDESMQYMEDFTLLHEIGHVVNSKLHITSDPEFQKLWTEYGEKMVLDYGIDGLDEEEQEEAYQYKMQIEEGCADLYSYAILTEGKDKLDAGIQPLFDYMWEKIQ